MCTSSIRRTKHQARKYRLVSSGPLSQRIDCRYPRFTMIVPTENLISAKKVKKVAAESALGSRSVIASPAAKRSTYQLLVRSGLCRLASSAPIFKEGWVSGGPSFVAVMQTADLWQCHHSPHVLRLDRSRLGRVLP